MARPRAADYTIQRDRILALAVEAFARTGYPGASMAMLAQACGTSKAALYHYFPGKQALLFEALDRYTRRLRDLIESVRSQGLAPRETLAAAVRALMAEYRHSHAYHAALLNDMRFLAPAQQVQIRAQESEVVEAIAVMLDRAAPGRIAVGERSVVTMALLGMINFTFAWLRPDGPVSHARFADLAAGLWLDGLSGQPVHTGDPRHEQAVRLQG